MCVTAAIRLVDGVLRGRALLVVALVALAACGPSAAQLRAARHARYDVDSHVVFEVARTIAERTYGVRESDEARQAVATAERWFSADGMSQGRGTEDHPATLSNGMVVLSFVIYVDGDDHAWSVVVEPVASRLVAWSSQMQPIGANDTPAWVQDKIDSLYLAIHDELKAYEVRAPSAGSP